MNLQQMRKEFLSPSQAELVEIANEFALQGPRIAAHQRNNSFLRIILARIVVVLNLQGQEDLWRLCDISEYDKALKLGEKRNQPVKVIGPRWSRDAFTNILWNLTALRYVSKRQKKTSVRVNSLTVPLSYSQLLLRALIMDEILQQRSVCDDIPKWLHVKLSPAIGYFIHYIGLEGPQNYPAFFKNSNYRKVMAILEEKHGSVPWKGQNMTNGRALALTLHYISGKVVSVYKKPSETLRKIPLEPREILADIQRTINIDVHCQSIQRARIASQKLDTETVQLLMKLYKHKGTRRYINGSLRFMLEYGGIQSLAELENREPFERFYQNLCQQKYSDKLINRRLQNLSSFMTKVIGKHSVCGVMFEVNHAQALLDICNLNAPKRRYICRDQDEVELWISTLPAAEERALWALYAEGLRLIEPLLHEDPYNPAMVIGLRWSQFDATRRCLMNVRRKNTSENHKEHAIIRLSESTVKLLQKHRKSQNDSDFMFSLSHRQVRSSYLKHFRRLQQWKEELNNNPTVDPQLLATLEKLVTRLRGDGKPGVTPHQFRHTWNTLAMNNSMQTEFSLYHMNHTQNTYRHFSDSPTEYFAEYDRTAPKYHYKVSLAKQVYPGLLEKKQGDKQRSKPSVRKARVVPSWYQDSPWEEGLA